MSSQGILEPVHNIGMATFRLKIPIVISAVPHEAVDEHIQHLMLQSSCNLWIEKHTCPEGNAIYAIRATFSQPRTTRTLRNVDHERRALKSPPPVTVRFTLAPRIAAW